MKRSMHAGRMERHQRRLKKTASLNLVSLMDIFTILVFFLMVNSSEIQVLHPSKHVKLPESVSEKRPKETLLVMVNDTEILLKGEKVADVTAAMANEELLIESLSVALRTHSATAPALTEEEKEKGRSVTIMGDKAIPYALLKKVMHTCSASEYTNIALAVEKKLGGDDDALLQELQEGASVIPATEGS